MGYTDLFGESNMATVFKVSSVVVCVVAVLGLVANALQIYSVLHQPGLRRSPTYLTLVSLAISDLLSLLAIITFIAVSNTTDLSYFLCLMLMCAGQAAICSSVHHVMAFSVLRYMILVKPLFAMKYLTVRSTIVTCAVIWIVGLTFSSFSVSTVQMLSFNTTANRTTSLCLYNLSSSPQIIAMMVVIVLIPLATIVAFHIAKVCQLRKRPVRPEGGSKREEVSIKIIVGILIAFAVTSLPNVLYFLAFRSSWELTLDDIALGYVFAEVCFMNSAVNPLFYFFFSERARNDVLCCKRKTTANKNLKQDPKHTDGVFTTLAETTHTSVSPTGNSQHEVTGCI